MQAWLVSDIHLKSVTEKNANVLLRLLDDLEKNSEVTHVVFLGDIFDLWISDGPIYVHRFQPIIEAVLKLKKKGLEVLYFEGNHDVHVKDFWQNKLGIPTYADAQYLNWGPNLIRLEHGDLINPDDKAYLRYRKFIRHPVMEKLAPAISLGLGPALDFAGRTASQWSRKRSYDMRIEKQNELRKMIRDYAKKEFFAAPADKKFNLIITGHMHVRDDWNFKEGAVECRSINLGSWFEPPAALKIDADLKCEFVKL